MSTNSLEFKVFPNANPTPADRRAAMMENPAFGRIFTDHMVVINYTEGTGWHDARIEARKPIPMDPASAVFHYAQEIFEGLKAYRTKDGGVTMFRPDANAKRFQSSARRMAMPELPVETFIEGLELLVKTDRDWIPTQEGGSLYLRPVMIASEAFLGVKPASEYLFIIIACPVGSYFKPGHDTVSVWVSNEYTRAAPGGTGFTKCGGNYAASLIAQAEAYQAGCDQVVFLDAVEHRWVDEMGGMNIFFAFDDGSLLTPPLSGTILPGVTRDSLLSIASAEGVTIREENYSLEQWKADAAAGKLKEAFACGTAAVITPIGTVKTRNGEFSIGDGGAGPVARKLKAALTAIQRGEAADSHGWTRKVI